MDALSVCLIVIGIVVIALSCFISDKVAEERMKQKAEEIITSAESRELIRRQASETVEKVIGTLPDEIAAGAERELSRLANEKIMAVHDYSETVIGEINKSHNEVMFLYSMLSDKDKEIKKTVSELDSSLKKNANVVNNAAMAADTLAGYDVPLTDKTYEAVQKTFSIPETSSGEAKQAAEKDNGSSVNSNSREMILKLAGEGYSDVEIAKMLKMGTGEVKLILGLFKGADK